MYRIIESLYWTPETSMTLLNDSHPEVLAIALLTHALALPAVGMPFLLCPHLSPSVSYHVRRTIIILLQSVLYWTHSTDEELKAQRS